MFYKPDTKPVRPLAEVNLDAALVKLVTTKTTSNKPPSRGRKTRGAGTANSGWGKVHGGTVDWSKQDKIGYGGQRKKLSAKAARSASKKGGKRS